jgi:NCS1 family nucleobase:cation symporter-1
VASISTNLVANFIPSQYSLINFMPNNLTLKSSSYTISVIGFVVGIFWLTLLSQIGILSFIDTFASFFGPIVGVVIIDFYLIKDADLSNKDLYSSENKSIYYYSKGWHIKAMYSIFLGFIFSASTIWNMNMMFLQSYAWIIGLIISSVTYYLLAKK